MITLHSPDSDYTFRNFVVSSGNRFAYTAAEAVVGAAGKAYNPLFIYGASGLGKTHLLHATGNKILRSNPSWTVIYITATQFTDMFIESIRKNESMVFEQKMKSSDVLLFDNIDELYGRETSQQVLLNILEHMLSDKKQIVLASAKSPNDSFGFIDRLQSRLSWGLITEITMDDPSDFMEKYLKKQPESIRNAIENQLPHGEYRNTAEIVLSLNRMADTLHMPCMIEGGSEQTDDIWNQILDKLKQHVSKPTFDTWFMPAKGKMKDNAFEIICSNAFSSEWLQSRYTSLLSKTFADVTGKTLPLHFVLADAVIHDTLAETPTQSPMRKENEHNDEIKQLLRDILVELKVCNATLSEQSRHFPSQVDLA